MATKPYEFTKPPEGYTGRNVQGRPRIALWHQAAGAALTRPNRWVRIAHPTVSQGAVRRCYPTLDITTRTVDGVRYLYLRNAVTA